MKILIDAGADLDMKLGNPNNLYWCNSVNEFINKHMGFNLTCGIDLKHFVNEGYKDFEPKQHLINVTKLNNNQVLNEEEQKQREELIKNRKNQNKTTALRFYKC